jgi:phosphate-selective porin
MVNALSPGRDRGAKIYGDLGLMDGTVSYHLGGFNGTAEDTSDNNGDKDLAFRLAYSPFRNSKSFWLKGLQFAGNVTWGNEGSSTSPAGQTIARTPNRFTFFASQTTFGDRLRYGGDFAWWVGPASLKFEYDVQTNQRNGLGPGGSNLDEVTATGWYVSSTWVVTGEDKQRSGNVIPRRPFIPFSDQNGLGAIELGLRWAELSFDSDNPVNLFSSSLSPVNIPGGGTTATNSAQSLTVGLNWYFNEWTRAMLNWNYYRYDNPLGTPFSCQLGSCSAAQLRAAVQESWEILSRLQIWF